jgi:dUTP pyrophosphatase
MTALGVAIHRLPHGADLALPEYASAESAGLDLMAAVASPVEIEAGARVVVPTGIAVALPQGFEAQIRPRSGLADEHGITVLNSPGTVDSDYRGEIKVILANFGQAAFTLVRGMRIAQMVVAPVSTVVWREVRRLPASARADGGLGSTGTMPPG